MTQLKGSDTFTAAKLTAADRKQIFAEIERISFDVPDSWEAELRVRRISLGSVEGLVIQGTQLLCGGTGNCETVVLRRSGGKWEAMFQKDAPIGDGFGFLPESSSGIPNFVVSTNTSAQSSNYIVYGFDGKYYRPRQCYESLKEQVKKVSCK